MCSSNVHNHQGGEQRTIQTVLYIFNIGCSILLQASALYFTFLNINSSSKLAYNFVRNIWC